MEGSGIAVSSSFLEIRWLQAHQGQFSASTPPSFFSFFCSLGFFVVLLLLLSFPTDTTSAPAASSCEKTRRAGVVQVAVVIEREIEVSRVLSLLMHRRLYVTAPAMVGGGEVEVSGCGRLLFKGRDKRGQRLVR